VRGILRLEIEKRQIGHADLENISESGSVTNDFVDPLSNNGSDGPESSYLKWNLYDGKEISGNGSNAHENPDFGVDDVSVKPLYKS